MTNNAAAPLYSLRGLPLIGWRDMSHALNYLFADGQLKQGTLVAINAEKLLTAEDNPEVRALIAAAEFKYADGISVVRSIRKKFPQAQVSRVAGADLWEALMARAGKEGTPVFLVGGKPEVLAQTEAKLRTQWNVNIVGSQDGYFTPEQRQALFARIHASGAKIVTVAMGSPKQELLMRDCREVHPHALYMGVGGTYDVFTGHVKRAPKIWQNLGLEWLYRLLSQPRRITRQMRLLRYLRRIVRLFHHAFDGGDALSGTCYRLLCRVRPPVYESFFWLSYRLVILVYVDGGRDLGNYRHWGLRPVLVSGDGAVDTGADCRRTCCVGEFGCGAPVW